MQVFGSPDTYIQQRNAVDSIGDHVGTLGSTALYVASPTAKRLTEEPATASLDDAGVDVTVKEFSGECSKAEIDRLSSIVGDVGAEFVIGAGGGKTLDTAKAVGEACDIDAVVVPTIASTDAPCSALSVVYTNDGEFEEYRFLSKHPTAVIVDTAVIAEAPTDLFVAGIGDALATWFEADATFVADGDNILSGKDTLAGHRIARLCYETVTEHAQSAIAAVESDRVTRSVDNVVEANTLLSGIGFESGGLAAAHSIHNGLTQVEATHGAKHGEKVNVGTLTQLVLEGRDDEFIEQVVRFSLDIGLPVTLAEIGLEDPTDEQLETVATAACAEAETIHNHSFEATPTMVADALVTADRFGRRVSSAYGDSTTGQTPTAEPSMPEAE